MGSIHLKGSICQPVVQSLDDWGALCLYATSFIRKH
jgi:hypothetical protein